MLGIPNGRELANAGNVVQGSTSSILYHTHVLVLCISMGICLSKANLIKRSVILEKICSHMEGTLQDACHQFHSTDIIIT